MAARLSLAFTRSAIKKEILTGYFVFISLKKYHLRAFISIKPMKNFPYHSLSRFIFLRRNENTFWLFINTGYNLSVILHFLLPEAVS